MVNTQIDIFNLLKIVIPIIAVVLGAYLAYRYGLKRKRFEDGTESHKKLRAVLSILLELWTEFTYVRSLASSETSRAIFLFKLPDALVHHLDFSLEKIKSKKDQYDLAVEDIKEIRVSLYYKIEGGLDYFMSTVSSTFYPLISTRGLQKDKKNITEKLTDDLVNELESKIKVLANNLNRSEEKEILDILINQNQEFVDESIDEIPDYSKMILSSITGGPNLDLMRAFEASGFIENDTFIWLIEKVGLLKLFQNSEAHISEIYELFPLNEKFSTSKLDKLPRPFLVFLKELKEIELDAEELNQYFINNREFYEMIAGMVSQVEMPSFSLRRSLLELNNGTASIQELFEEIRQELPEIPEVLLEDKTKT